MRLCELHSTCRDLTRSQGTNTHEVHRPKLCITDITDATEALKVLRIEHASNMLNMHKAPFAKSDMHKALEMPPKNAIKAC